MLYLGLLLTIVTGFVFVHCFSVRFTPAEKIGLSFLLGLTLQVFLMLFIDQAGIPFTPFSLLTGQALMLSGLCAFVYFYRKDMLDSLKAPVWLSSLRGVNMVWLLLVAAIIYVEYMNISKCLYFPVTDRDSLAGFETIGYIAAREHTFKGISIFDDTYIEGIHGPASYITYAPLVQLAYAYVYVLGAESSKVINGLVYLFFLVAFYGATSRVAGKTGAAAATLFMLLTPEMLSFSSLSMTNVIHAVFASLSVIYMALWLGGKERDKKDLVMCGALLGANILCRTEGIVFTGAVAIVLFIDAVRRKEYKSLIPPALLAFVPLLCWTLYKAINGMYSEGIAITHPFWDAGKAGTILTHIWRLFTNTIFYGLSFVAFLIAFLANLWFMIRRGDSIYILAGTVLSMLLYIALLYQIDYKWDTMENVLLYSAKRFMFCFIPLLWYFTFTNHAVRTVFIRLERLLLIDKA
ncbi:MAG: glycosyltransferase family 39 protein [Tannerellaceae bacterium]|jgi:hypothetical protein|nr:glycosyltransferase family 39 protein [Tannerellaceae bacterium]